MKKQKIYICLLVILIIVALIILLLIFKKHNSSIENEEKLIQVVSTIKNNEQPEKIVEYEGYQVIGIIRIPEIELEYPILNETTEQSLKKSITKFWGCGVNEIGNITLSGHNNIDNKMFGKIKKLELDDLIELEDLNNNIVQYKIFDKYIIDPNDVTCTESVQKDTREVTLVTCTNGNKNRLVIKAREIKK